MDVVVTVPKGIWDDWIAEGDAAGSPDSGEEWGFYTAGPKPTCQPGDRCYIVAHGAIRGFAAVRRIVRHHGLWAICRGGGAVAVTIRDPAVGFRGWRARWWDRDEEVPFPAWRDPIGHAAMFEPQLAVDQLLPFRARAAP